MDKKNFRASAFLSLALAFGLLAGSPALAQEPTMAGQNPETPTDIQYPIAELGNCQNQGACAAFCDEAENTDACLAFAEKHQLMSQEEVAMARKFQALGGKGPGGCDGQEACEAYCGLQNNVEACVDFAEKNSLMPEDKLQEAKKAATAIKDGVQLSCKSQSECDKYCASAEGMEECINFGADAGILPVADQENARKVLTAVKNGAVPPCHGKECETYCNSLTEHFEECGKFAQEAGIVPPQQMIAIQRILTAIQEGATLPACDGEEECQDYCSQNDHFEECVKFAEAAGAMTSQEAEAAKKTGGEGPDGCKTKEECDAFCENQDNSEICFNFAKEKGLISEEDEEKIRNSQRQMKESFNDMPEGVLSCLASALGADTIEKLKSGNAMPGQKMAEQMKTCYKQFMPQETSTSPQDGQSQGTGQEKPQKPQQPNQSGQSEQPAESAEPAQPQQPAKPEKPADAVNPTQCVDDCEYVGKTCLAEQAEADKVCLEQGQYCRQVTCEALDAEGNRPTQEEYLRCNASKCEPAEAACHAAVTAKSSACTTAKDECVTACQKAAKNQKPTQPTQPNQPASPNTGTAKPSKPAEPAGGATKPAQPQQPAKPEKPADAVNPTQCVDDCEYVGKTCLAEATAAGNVCLSQGQYCRTVYCETYGVEGDNRPTQEQYHACNDKVCAPAEAACNSVVTAASSACTTAKDECVTACQKAAKNQKPAQPTQSNQPAQPQPPSQPSQPSPPGQPE